MASLKRPGALSLRRSLNEYGLGVAGGLLFSIPLLYTNEIWDWGSAVAPGRLLLALLVTFSLLLAYNRFAGLRRDASALEVAIDSVEEYGLGLVISFLLLWLLGRIVPGMSFQEVMGKIVLEAMLVAVGVSIGTAQLGLLVQGGRQGAARVGQGLDGDPGAVYGFRDLGSTLALSLCGAYLLAVGVAATQEVLEIGGQSDLWKMAALALLSLLLGALILFSSAFSEAGRAVAGVSLPLVLRDAFLTYAVALATSGALLWFYGRFTGETLATGLAYTVVVGFPAVLGASAGRLLLAK